MLMKEHSELLLKEKRKKLILNYRLFLNWIGTTFFDFFSRVIQIAY